MEQLIHRFRNLLGQQLPESEFIPEPVEQRLSGLIIWRGFEGISSLDRQRRIRQLISLLPQEEQLSFSVILAHTPDEMHAIQHLDAKADGNA